MPGQQAPLAAAAAPDGTNAPGGAKLMWGGEAGMEGAAAAAKKYMGKPMDYYRLQTLQQFLSIYSADAEQVLGLARRQVTKLLGADATKKVFGGRHELFEEHRPLARFRSQFAKVLRASDDAGDHLTASFLEEQERQAKVAMTTTVGQGQGQGQGGRAGRVEERGGARRQRRREQQQHLLQKASKVHEEPTSCFPARVHGNLASPRAHNAGSRASHALGGAWSTPPVFHPLSPASVVSGGHLQSLGPSCYAFSTRS
jgi:hypothetical protein